MWIMKSEFNFVTNQKKWEVGYYDPEGVFQSQFTVGNETAAVDFVNQLNGGPNNLRMRQLQEILEDLTAAVEQIAKILGGK